MIVDVIHVDGVPGLEAEGNPPIPGHRNGIVPFQNSLKCVQPKARKVHILSRSASVQDREKVAQLVDMLRSHASCRSSIVQSFQPAMSERTDHSPDV